MASSARIEELTKKFEENPRRYFAPLANEYRKAGDLSQAIAICRAHLPQQPGHMSGHVVFGQALFESGALDEAKSVFETALQLDPENLIALRYLGDIALRRGDRSEARVWYYRVLEVDPRNEEIQGLLLEVDGQRTPLAVPSVPDASDAIGESSTPAYGFVSRHEPPESASEDDYALPSELPPAVIDAETELLEDSGLLDGFSAPGDELRREDAAETPDAGQLAGLEPTGFDSAARSDMAGGSTQPPVSDEQAVLLDFPDSVEPMGFEPTSAEPITDDARLDLEREESSLGGQPIGFTPSLSFEDEPADAAPFQVGPSEQESVQLPAHEPAMGDASVEKASIESPSSLDTVPSEAATVDAAPSVSEALPDDAEPVAAGFVTETMAELYLRQGHREAALDVYRQLAAQQPDDARLRERIEELDRTGEPSIRSFLAGIASRRPRSGAYDAREAIAAPSGEWVAIPSDASNDAAERPAEVMGWQESNDVVSEIPLADAAEAGELPAEITPAVLDGMDELSERTSEPASEAPRRAAPFTVDESAVPFDLPRSALPAATAIGAAQGGSLDALFGNAPASAEDDAAATTLAQVFAPVQDDAPLGGRPAAPARDELSLDRVFRGEERSEAPQSGGFSFDQFFGSRTPHAGNMTVPQTPSGTPQTPGETPPGASPTAAGPDDIEQFNSWLQGLKKR